MRQTETSAMKKANKNCQKEASTFSRAVVAVFSPASVIEDDDPAFSDLVRKANSDADGDDSSEDNDENLEDDNNVDLSQEEQEIAESKKFFNGTSDNDFQMDNWLVSLCGEQMDDATINSDKETTTLGLVAIDIQSHFLKYQVYTYIYILSIKCLK